MAITMPDPAARLLDLPPPADRTAASGVRERKSHDGQGATL